MRKLLLSSLLLLTMPGIAAASQPNIVVILTDDQPVLDGRLMTLAPTLNSTFVRHGITFSHMDGTDPLCCPDRGTYYTGQYVHHHGVTFNNAGLFDPAESLATELQDQNYFTFLAGKYFNKEGKDCINGPLTKQGHHNNPNCAPNVPVGWNEFHAFDEPGYFKYTLWDNGHPTSYGKADSDYSTDVVRDRALAAMDLAPADQPIFAWIAPYGIHVPATPPARYSSAPQCAGPQMHWKSPSYNEADVSDKPTYVQQSPKLSSKGFQLAKLCESLLAVDDLVAAVKQKLSDEGRLSNTILIFAGDNGMNAGDHRLDAKMAPYGTQLPFYVSWPDQLGTSPRTVSGFVQNTDVAPTLCEIAGCEMGPYPNGQQHPDGRSFYSLLTGEADSIDRPELFDEEHAPNSENVGNPPWDALRTTETSPWGLWHYVEYGDGEKELYDLSTDPNEMENGLRPDQTPSDQAQLMASIFHDDLVDFELDES